MQYISDVWELVGGVLPADLSIANKSKIPFAYVFAYAPPPPAAPYKEDEHFLFGPGSEDFRTSSLKPNGLSMYARTVASGVRAVIDVTYAP
jgi:hypothetical protein